jgi:hypothetical protein
MQNGTRISNIIPPKVMEEADALRLLTTYKVFTIRKVTPNNPREKATWALAEISEERLAQSEIMRLVKKLNEGKKTVTDKKTNLAHNQTGQVNRLMDDLISNERDMGNFEWALVQLDSFQKDLPAKERGEKKKRETVTLTVYAKRAPLPDKNPIVLYHQLERMKMEFEREQREHERMMQEAMRRPAPSQQQPHPQQHPGPQPGAPAGYGVINLGNAGGGNGRPKGGRNKHGGPKKHHRSSDTSSVTSYTDSDLSDTESFDSSMSSVSSSSYSDRKDKRRHSRPNRSHSRHRPEVRTIYIDRRSPSPRRLLGEGRHFGEFGEISPPPRPYAPEVPRMAPVVDPIASSYQAGKAAYQAGIEDARAERFGSPERPTQLPIIIERIVERPRPVISYGRQEILYPESRRQEPPRRFLEDRENFVEEYPEEDYVARRQEAEEYIHSRSPHRTEYRRVLEPRQFGRRQSSPPIRPERFDRHPNSPGEAAFGRRPSIGASDRVKFHSPNPFNPVHPIQLPRAYPPSHSTDSYGREHRHEREFARGW